MRLRDFFTSSASSALSAVVRGVHVVHGVQVVPSAACVGLVAALFVFLFFSIVLVFFSRVASCLCAGPVGYARLCDRAIYENRQRARRMRRQATSDS